MIASNLREMSVEADRLRQDADLVCRPVHQKPTCRGWFSAPCAGLLVSAKQVPEAKELAKRLIAMAITRGDSTGLRSVSSALRNESAKGNADLTALAIKAAEAAYELDQENVATLLSLVEAYAFADDQAKVKEFGPKAVAAAKAAVSGEKDAIGTLTVAAAYLASGDKAQAKSTAEKAIKMIDRTNAGMLRYVQQQAKKYGAE